LNRYLANPGHNLALRQKPVPHKTLAALVVQKVHVTCHELRHARNPSIAGLKDGMQIPMDIFCALHHVLFSPEGNLAAMGDAALHLVGKSRQVAMTVPVFSGVCRAVSESDLIALVPAQLASKVAKTFGLRVFEPPMKIDPALIIGIWHKRSDNAPMAA
jgi:DNA-binding transcriptional LysR family regulator